MRRAITILLFMALNSPTSAQQQKKQPIPVQTATPASNAADQTSPQQQGVFVVASMQLRSDSASIYKYTVINNSQSTIVGLVIGFDPKLDYELDVHPAGWQAKLGKTIPKAMSSSPPGWSPSVQMQESDNIAIEWRPQQTDSIAPGKTATGFSVTTSKQSDKYLTGHWTTYTARGETVSGVLMRQTSPIPPSSPMISAAAASPSLNGKPGGGYTFQVIARDGDVIDGRKLGTFNGILRGSTNLLDSEKPAGPALNDAGQIAFIANTDKGPTVFLDKKALAYAGMQISGKTIVSVGRPSINRQGSVAYKMSYQDGTCGLCGREGIVVNDALVLKSNTPIEGCGHGVINHLGSPTINSNNSYVVFATTDDYAGCDQAIIIDGKPAVAPNAQIGEIRLSHIYDPPAFSLTDDKDIAFFALQNGVPGHPAPSNYICTLHECREIAERWKDGPILNNNRQLIYSIIGAKIKRASDSAQLHHYPSLAFAMNDKGDIFTDIFEFINYSDPIGPDQDYGASYFERIRITSVVELARLIGAKAPPHASLNPVAINNRGQVAFVIYYTEAGDAVTFAKLHEVLIIGTPHNMSPVEPPAPTMVDPVTIPTSPSTAAKILSTPKDLVSADARTVVGIAADGVARVVVRIPTSQAGQTVTVSICAEKREDAAACGKQNPNEYGVLASQSDLQKDLAASTAQEIRATSVNVDGTSSPKAFVVYRAPLDFTRKANAPLRPVSAPNTSSACPAGYIEDDCKAATRSVFLKVTYTPPSSIPAPPIEVKIVRPPVVLVHGFNANSSAWDDFEPPLNRAKTLAVFRANYGQSLRLSLVPSYGNTDLLIRSSVPPIKGWEEPRRLNEVAKQSHFGFTFVSPCVLDQMREIVGLGRPVKRRVCISDISPVAVEETFRGGHNPAHVPVAAVQVDAITHSMGGLVVRHMLTDPDYRGGGTFEQGIIHKLVTIGTPHLGSPQAVLQLLPESACSRSEGVPWPVGTISVDGFDTNSGYVPGAVGELRGNGQTITPGVTSQALVGLSADSPIGLVPTALLAGDMGNMLPDGKVDILSAFWKIRHDCGGSDPFASRFSRNRYGTIFDPNIFSAVNPLGSSASPRNDGSVPASSAIPKGFVGKLFPGYVHSVGIYGLTGHAAAHLQDGTDPLMSYVSSLLNEPVRSDKFNRMEKAAK